MKDILISIIVPVFNVEKYIEDCIQSLINQTYRNIEMIFVNDGSTDSSLDILESYARMDERIKIITQSNQGVSDARNKGLSKAIGEYVLFVDSDDWIDRETCEKALAVCLEENADIVIWSYVREYVDASKPTLLFNDNVVVWDAGEVRNIYRRMIGLVGYELKEPQRIDAVVTVWGKLYKKDILNGIDFIDTKVIGTEDALYNIYVFSKVKKVVYLPNTYSHYRKYNFDSLTHKYKSDLVLRWKEMYGIIHDHLDVTVAPEEFYIALSNRICLGLIGLGLNLAEDNTMKLGEKLKELKRILTMEQYQRTLQKMSLEHMPFYWKLFFYLCKKKSVVLLYGLLQVMEILRGK